MSLQTELAEDRRYISEIMCEDHVPRTLREAAIDILRTIIAPTFRAMHYEPQYRQAVSLGFAIDFSKASFYRTLASSRWDFSSLSANKQFNFFKAYPYPADFDKFQLWQEVQKVAREDEWQIDSDPLYPGDTLLYLSLYLQ